jgi:hypothetical protein
VVRGIEPGLDGPEIEALDDVEDEPHEVVIGQPVPDVRREQGGLRGQPFTDGLHHGPSRSRR